MNELFSLVNSALNGEAIQTVSARELHEYLEVKRDFSTWFKDRVFEYGFIENVDFVVDTFSPNLGKTPNGGRPRTEYHITLGLAKELAMVERNERGKQARQYFIACESRAQHVATVPKTLPEALRLAAEQMEKRQEAETQLALAAPKAVALDLISQADGDMCITDAAKTLKIQPRKLFDLLSHSRWIFKRDGKGEWIGYQNRIESGLLHHSQHTHFSERLQQHRITTRVLITPKGLIALAKKLAAMETGAAV